MSWQERVLASMADEGVDEDFIAKQAMQVVKGESRRTRYEYNKQGERRIVSEEITVTQESAALGLTFFSRLQGQSVVGLGLPDIAKETAFIPDADDNIIARPTVSPTSRPSEPT